MTFISSKFWFSKALPTSIKNDMSSPYYAMSLRTLIQNTKIILLISIETKLVSIEIKNYASSEIGQNI